jgi:hypothetical protein
MANAVDIVKKRTVRRTDEFIHRSTETLSSETVFYGNAMIGVDTTGYYCKGDDAQSWVFAGVVTQDQGAPTLPAATAGDRLLNLRIQQPLRFELAIASIAVTDIGKKVYAIDDQTGTLDASTRTFANFVGHVVDVTATGIALVEPVYDGVAANARYGVARVLAATGAQSLTKCDLNKTILVPNTAALTITLPAIADTQAGDRLTFVKTTSAAFAATLDGNASETIDGSATLATIDAQFDCATLVSVGDAWVVLARDIA